MAPGVTRISPFAYSELPHVRRHGPGGWSPYGKYRDWVRDEFSFRCVYCLTREKWSDMRRPFHIDHHQPKAIRPDLECEYTNLLLLCPNCNQVKSTSLVPDPCETALGKCVAVERDGKMKSLNEVGRRMILELALNNRTLVEFRRKTMETLDVLASVAPHLYVEWMGFPKELPDLSASKPRHNTKPEGVEMCWHKQRERGQLPLIY